MRKLAVLGAVPIIGALLGIAPAVAQPAPGATAFCDAALTTDKAADKALGGGKPKQKDVQALDTALAQVESTAPSELTATVQAVAAAVRTGIQSQKDPSQDPTFVQNLNAIDEYRYNSCGYQTADVTATEYEFAGLPKTLTPGPVAIKLADTGAELHEMQVFRLKTKDSVKKVLQEGKKGEKKMEVVGSGFVMQGKTDYIIADLTKPGRYGVACHLPVGSTDEKAAAKAAKEHGGGTPHWKKGMFATITVPAA